MSKVKVTWVLRWEFQQSEEVEVVGEGGEDAESRGWRSPVDLAIVLFGEGRRRMRIHLWGDEVAWRGGWVGEELVKSGKVNWLVEVYVGGVCGKVRFFVTEWEERICPCRRSLRQKSALACRLLTWGVYSKWGRLAVLFGAHYPYQTHFFRHRDKSTHTLPQRKEKEERGGKSTSLLFAKGQDRLKRRRRAHTTFNFCFVDWCRW